MSDSEQNENGTISPNDSILSDNFLAENEFNVEKSTRSTPIDVRSPFNSDSEDEYPPPPVLTPQVYPTFTYKHRDSETKVLGQSKLQQISYNSTPLSSKPTVMEKLAVCRKFGGYPHENGSAFLNEFESYATLHNILDSEPQRKIAAFHLHLTGPAIAWYNSLQDPQKQSWEVFSTSFKTNYVTLDWSNPTLLMENEVFENLRLSPGQALEDFHCQLVEKAQILAKPDYEVMCKFIKGLPKELAFFVRAGCPKTSTSALTAAKMGEVSGYRSHDEITVAAASTTKSAYGKPPINAEKSEISELRSQVSNLTEKVENMTLSNRQKPRHRYNNNENLVRQNSQNQTQNYQRENPWNSMQNYQREASHYPSQSFQRNVPQNTLPKFQKHDPQNQMQNFQPHQQNENDQFFCYRCNGKYHIKRNCLWNGQGESNPDAQCQICSQFGHAALQCHKLGNIQNPGDIRHAPSGEQN